VNHSIWIKRTSLPLVIGLLTGCEQPFEEPSLESLAVQNISVECVSGILSHGPSDIVITSQAEYEQFIDEKFKQRLDGTWNQRYPDVLEAVKQEYPGLTEAEYEQLATEKMFEEDPFIWGKECGYPDGGPLYNNPEVNFYAHALLGARVIGGGCSGPEFDLLEAFKDDSQMKYIFRIHVIWYGHCSMALYGLVWALVARLPEGYTVEFDRQFTVVDVS